MCAVDVGLIFFFFFTSNTDWWADRYQGHQPLVRGNVQGGCGLLWQHGLLTFVIQDSSWAKPKTKHDMAVQRVYGKVEECPTSFMWWCHLVVVLDKDLAKTGILQNSKWFKCWVCNKSPAWCKRVRFQLPCPLQAQYPKWMQREHWQIYMHRQ